MDGTTSTGSKPAIIRTGERIVPYIIPMEASINSQRNAPDTMKTTVSIFIFFPILSFLTSALYNLLFVSRVPSSFEHTRGNEKLTVKKPLNIFLSCALSFLRLKSYISSLHQNHQHLSNLLFLSSLKYAINSCLDVFGCCSDQTGKKVYTIERFGQLSESAQLALGRLGINDVEFFIGNGRYSRPKRRLVDKIIITSAVPKIPESLAEHVADYNNLVFRFYRAQGPYYFCGGRTGISCWRQPRPIPRPRSWISGFTK